MNHRISVFVLVVVSLAGCASITVPADGPDHPASPDALAGTSLAAEESTTPVSSTTQPLGRYVCPMHPQITSDSPGNCSICGMKLVERKAEGATHEHH